MGLTGEGRRWGWEKGEHARRPSPRNHIYCRRLRVYMCQIGIPDNRRTSSVSPTLQRRYHTPTSKGKRGERERREWGGGGEESEEEGGVEWLEQLLVKDLSQSITSVPIVSAETGEGVTQTCLRLPTAVFAQTLCVCAYILYMCVCCQWYYIADLPRHTPSHSFLFQIKNSNTEMGLMLLGMVSGRVC